MNMVDIALQVDKELKEQAEEIFNKLGLNLSSAFTAFLKQSIQEQKLPSELTMDTDDKLVIATEKEVKQAYEEETKDHFGAYRELGK